MNQNAYFETNLSVMMSDFCASAILAVGGDALEFIEYMAGDPKLEIDIA